MCLFEAVYVDFVFSDTSSSQQTRIFHGSLNVCNVAHDDGLIAHLVRGRSYQQFVMTNIYMEEG